MSAATDNNSMDVTYSKATTWFARMWDEISFALDQFYYSEVSESLSLTHWVWQALTDSVPLLLVV